MPSDALLAAGRPLSASLLRPPSGLGPKASWTSFLSALKGGILRSLYYTRCPTMSLNIQVQPPGMCAGAGEAEPSALGSLQGEHRGPGAWRKGVWRQGVWLFARQRPSSLCAGTGAPGRLNEWLEPDSPGFGSWLCRFLSGKRSDSFPRLRFLSCRMGTPCHPWGDAVSSGRADGETQPWPGPWRCWAPARARLPRVSVATAVGFPALHAI